MIFHKRRSRTEFGADGTGSALVEFALTSVVLLMMIFGILDFSRALYADHFVAYAAREATRYAMVRGSSWNNAACSTTSTFSCTATSTNIQDFVKGIAPTGLTASNLTITPIWPGTTASGVACGGTSTNAPNCVVKVQVNYAFGFVMPFLPKNILTLTSTAAVVIAQ